LAVKTVFRMEPMKAGMMAAWKAGRKGRRTDVSWVVKTVG